MNLYTDKLKADGFKDNEIRKIQAHCAAAEKAGTFSTAPAFVQLTGEPQLCCRTIAEILDQLRPGCWLDREQPISTRKTKRRSRKEIAAIREFAMKSDNGNLIKVHYTYPQWQPDLPSGEFLNARRINENTARIDNIPFATATLACGDLVRFNKNREITQILEHVANTRMLIYADPEWLTDQEIAERYYHIREELKQYDIITEAMFSGVCSISVPKDIDDDELESIANRLDAEVVTHEDETQD